MRSSQWPTSHVVSGRAATCQSVLLALEPTHWVRRTKDGYTLGAGLISIGAAAQRGAAVVGLLREAVRTLYKELDCEVLGYLPTGDQLVNVIRSGPSTAMSITMEEGQAFPLAPPNGLAFVAWDDAELENWISRAPKISKAGQTRLRRAAGMVRELGYSVILDPISRREFRSTVEMSESRRKFVASALAHDDLVHMDSEFAGAMRVSLLSAPVFGADGEVNALMAVVFDVSQYAKAPEFAYSLKSACWRLSERLGAPNLQELEARPA